MKNQKTHLLNVFFFGCARVSIDDIGFSLKFNSKNNRNSKIHLDSAIYVNFHMVLEKNWSKFNDLKLHIYSPGGTYWKQILNCKVVFLHFFFNSAKLGPFKGSSWNWFKHHWIQTLGVAPSRFDILRSLSPFRRYEHLKYLTFRK